MNILPPDGANQLQQAIDTRMVRKYIQWFLFACILVGIGLLLTHNIWVPKLVAKIISYERTSTKKNVPIIGVKPTFSTTTTSIVAKKWLSLSSLPDAPTSTQIYRGGNPNVSTDFVLFKYDGSIPTNQLMPQSDPDYPDADTIKLTAYYRDYQDIFISPQVDRTTFEINPFGQDYARDKNLVYFTNCDPGGCAYSPIKSVDPATFEIFVTPGGTSTWYGKDKDSVYLSDEVISEADPNTFAVFLDSFGNPTSFARDKNHIYVGAGVVENPDIDSFSVINERFRGSGFMLAKDNHAVYCEGGPLTEADIETFELLPLHNYFSEYFKDKNHVWLMCNMPIEGADASTFTPVDNPYADQGVLLDAKDKNHSYYRGEIVQIP